MTFESFCDIWLYDLIMVSHALWKTWPEALSRQKARPKAEVFVVTGVRARLQIYFFPCFFHMIMNFSALK